MITTVQPSKRKGKRQQIIPTGNDPGKRNLTQSAFSLDRKAYQNPIRKESVLVQTSRAAVISAATPFSIPIRYSSFNLNANTEALKFTPRSGSMPRIVGEEPGDYGDREAVLFHQRKEKKEGEEGEEGEKGEEGEPIGKRVTEKVIKKENAFKEKTKGTIEGMTQGDENAARLADLAYKAPEERDLSFFTNEGYVVDEDFSTDEHIVIVHPGHQQVAVGLRGTAFNLNNMLTDATIALGGFENSERARRTLELREQLKARYPAFDFFYSGHSMGGTAAAYAAQDDPNAAATTFNAGSTPYGGATETSENVRNIRTEGDAISQGISNAVTIPKQCSSSLAHSSSQFVPGAPCEKPGFFSFIKNSVEAAANVAAKGIKTFSPLVPPEINVPLKIASGATTKLLGEAERQNRALQKTRKQPYRKTKGLSYRQEVVKGEPMEGIDYTQPMQIEAPPEQRQLPPPPERRQLPPPPERRQLPPPPERRQLTAPPEQRITRQTGRTPSDEIDWDWVNTTYEALVNSTKPGQYIPTIQEFVDFALKTGRGKMSSMDWVQTHSDKIAGIVTKQLPPNNPPSTAVRRSAITGRAMVPLLEYSAGGEPASTSSRQKQRMTADREILGQLDKVIEGRTRREKQSPSELEVKFTVGYWKGKPQPPKPKKKQNETKKEFATRQSDYNQFIQLWKAANVRRQPARKAKKI